MELILLLSVETGVLVFVTIDVLSQWIKYDTPQGCLSSVVYTTGPLFTHRTTLDPQTLNQK